MIKKISFLFLLLLAFSLHNLKAQNIAKDDVATCFFLINFSSEFGIEADKAFNDTVYNKLTLKLKEIAGIALYPADYLKGKIPYDFRGYPLSTAKKSAKTKASKNYLHITFDLSPSGWATTKTNSTTLMGIEKDKSKTTTKLKLAIVLTIYDENAQKLVKIKASSVSTSEVLIESETFRVSSWGATEYKQNDNNIAIVQELISSAIEDAAKQLKK